MSSSKLLKVVDAGRLTAKLSCSDFEQAKKTLQLYNIRIYCKSFSVTYKYGKTVILSGLSCVYNIM